MVKRDVRRVLYSYPTKNEEIEIICDITTKIKLMCLKTPRRKIWSSLDFAILLTNN